MEGFRWSSVYTENSYGIHSRQFCNEDDYKCHKVDTVVERMLRRCGNGGTEVKQTDYGGAELSTRGILPAMIQLFPPGAFVVGGRTDGPVGGKGTTFEPVKDIKSYDGVQNVDDCPGVEGVASGKQAG